MQRALARYQELMPYTLHLMEWCAEGTGSSTLLLVTFNDWLCTKVKRNGRQDKRTKDACCCFLLTLRIGREFCEGLRQFSVFRRECMASERGLLNNKRLFVLHNINWTKQVWRVEFAHYENSNSNLVWSLALWGPHKNYKISIEH